MEGKQWLINLWGIGCLFVVLFSCFSAPAIAESVEEARRLGEQATELHRKGRYVEAIPVAERALEILTRLLGPTDPNTTAGINNLAMLHESAGDYRRAEKLYKRALEIDERTLGAEHPDVAISLNNLGLLYCHMAEYRKAESLLTKSLQITEGQFGVGHPQTAASINNLAAIHKSSGDFKKAETLYKRSLEICQKAFGEQHQHTAASMNNLGLFYLTIGDYRGAATYLNRALQGAEKALGPQHPETAKTVLNLALLHQMLGDFSSAERLHVRASEIKKTTLGGDHPSVAYSLGSLASLYRASGEYEKAEALYKKSQEVLEKALGWDHPGAIHNLNNLGFLYVEKGEIDKARRVFMKHNLAEGFGRCYLAQGDYLKAREEFLTALKMYEQVGSKDSILDSCIGLGTASEGLGDFAGAKTHFMRAVELIESQREALAANSRESFISAKTRAGFARTEAYEGVIRILLKKKDTGFEKDSLSYAERLKSRLFVEMLATRSIRGNSITEQKSFDRDREFQQRLTALKRQLLSLDETGSGDRQARNVDVQRELEQVSAQYELFLKEIKLQNAELASLLTVMPPDIDALQAHLDTDTTLLEYFTSKEKIYAWLLSREKVSVREIILSEKALGEKVNSLLLANMSNQPRRPEPKIILASSADKEVPMEERKKNREHFLDAAEDLYRILLAPLMADIRTEKLIIVPHGALHKVPFAALHDGTKYLIDLVSLTIFPSASVIPYIVNKRNPDKGELLAFGNPKTDHAPLEFAEREVERVSGAFPKKDLHFREKATEEKAKKGCGSSDVVHFACHGEFNDMQPLQSGILLSSEGGEDGRLQVHEIFGLDLRNANLVTLSACQTALGKITSGDDMVGLSRAFIFAGTPSLLASLWEVDDESTALLMERFYENWRKKGMSKPEALRQAQLNLKAVPGYEHPYYWAAFEMIGDWR